MISFLRALERGYASTPAQVRFARLLVIEGEGSRR
jgi:hypothetical protein